MTTNISITIAKALQAIEKSKQLRYPAGSSKGGQFRAKTTTISSSSSTGTQQSKPLLPVPSFHPHRDENGKPVLITHPTTASPPETWKDPNQAAVFVPKGKLPAALNGIPFTSWKDAPTTAEGWNSVGGQMQMKEPKLPKAYDASGQQKRNGAGVIVQEPDGRVWIVEPTNHFGGYHASFPKGGQEKDIKSLQANAIKEAFEESGLKVKITGIVGDYEGDTSISRFYRAERVGGKPTDAGWETQSVKLVPPNQLQDFLNRARDKKIANDFNANKTLAKSDTQGFRELQLAVNRANANAQIWLSKKGGSRGTGSTSGGSKFNSQHPRYPAGSPKGGEFMPKGGAGGLADAVSAASSSLASAQLAMGAHKPALATGSNPNNSALLAANKKITAMSAMANKGDVVGLAAMKPTEPTAKSNPYQKAVWNNWNSAVGYAQSLSSTGAGSSSTKATRAIAEPMNLSTMTYVAPKPGGSNPGGIYKDANGAQWLVKGAGSPDVAKNEVLAARLYNLAGVDAPEMKTITLGNAHGGGLGVASRMLDGPLSAVNTSKATIKEAQKGFAVDAWLANWDSVGLQHDNIVVTKEGKAVRIDPGGSLLYRAMGTPKGKAFDGKATELNTLRDKTKNAQAASVYGDMTSSEIANSSLKVAAISNKDIEKLVNKYGPGTDAEKADLSAKLIERKQAIVDQVKALQASADTSSNDNVVAATNTINAKKMTSAELAELSKSAPKPPLFPTVTKKMGDLLTGASLFVNQAMGMGKFDDAKMIYEKIIPPSKKGNLNSLALVSFDKHYEQLLNHYTNPPAAKPTTPVARANAAMAAAKPDVKPVAAKPITPLPAMPVKPNIVTPANPNKSLGLKIDQIEAIASAHQKGTITAEQAQAALSAVTIIGSNTYYKKANAYKSDVIASIGGKATTTEAITATSTKAKVAPVTRAQEAIAAAAKVKPKEIVIDQKMITQPPDFNKWPDKGNQPLSSNKLFNDQNNAEVGKIYAMAQKGDLEGLKAYKTSSPSQHVSSYLQQVTEDVNLQKNPPPKMEKITVGGKTRNEALAQISAAAVPLKHPSETKDKLAFYPVIAKIDTPEKYTPPAKAKYSAGLTNDTYAAASHEAFNKLPENQQEAIRSYTGSGYNSMNPSFRTGSPTPKAKLAALGMEAAAVPLKQGTVLSRKVTMDQKQISQLIAHGKGKVVQEFAISSTSINPNNWGGNVQFRLTTAEGARGLFAGYDAKGTKPISNHAHEQEIILGANARMLITKVYPKGTPAGADNYGDKSVVLVDAVLLP